MTSKLENQNGLPKNNQNQQVRIPKTPNLIGEITTKNGVITEDLDIIVQDSLETMQTEEIGVTIEMVNFMFHSYTKSRASDKNESCRHNQYF